MQFGQFIYPQYFCVIQKFYTKLKKLSRVDNYDYPQCKNFLKYEFNTSRK